MKITLTKDDVKRILYEYVEVQINSSSSSLRRNVTSITAKMPENFDLCTSDASEISFEVRL